MITQVVVAVVAASFMVLVFHLAEPVMKSDNFLISRVCFLTWIIGTTTVVAYMTRHYDPTAIVAFVAAIYAYFIARVIDEVLITPILEG